MRNSIRMKLFFSIVLIIIISSLIGLVINNSIFGEMYIKNQEQELLKSAEKIEEFLLENNDAQNLIDKISENNGYTIFFFDNYDSFDNRGGRGGPKSGNISHTAIKQYNEALNKKFDYMIYYNQINESNFLRLIYIIDERILVIEAPIQLLTNSKELNNKMFLIITSISILITMIFSYFFSKRFTKPILEINRQAKNIANLEFNDKFSDIKNKDEISLLGENMNFLSNKLESTISMLNLEINKLEDMENSRKELIANISHELKTPIALIKGYAEGLKYNINEKDGEYEEIIIDEAVKMNNLVKELLNLSDIEAGKINMKFEETDLSSLIDEMLFKYRLIFKNRKIDLSIEKEDIVYVNIDSVKIEEVMTNFLNNALSHIDNKKLIKINLIESELKVRFELFNSGKNIKEEDIDSIWTSFYRADKSRNRENGRTGLGLYISKTIVEKHNGNYGVINEKNGVTFFFELAK